MSSIEKERVEAEVVPPEAKAIRPVPRLQYIHSYTYVFESNEGFLNLALVSVCTFIPIIGPIVVAGYQYDIVAGLHTRPKQTYPEFDFGRFGEYLGRGIWKFLADMIGQMFIAPAYMFAYFMSVIVVMVVVGATSSNQPGGQPSGAAVGIALAIVIPLAIAFVLGVTILLRLFLNPLILKASLSGEGSDLFDFRFMIDFVKKTWRETILEMMWVYVTFPIMMILGLCLCFVGVYPAIAWTMLADAHTNWQLYEVYLARGGEPIRLKMDKPGPVVVLADQAESEGQ